MYLNSYMKSGKKLSEMTEVERGKDMAPLLYDLLTTQSCSEFGEDKIIKLITDFIPSRTTLANGGNFVIVKQDTTFLFSPYWLTNILHTEVCGWKLCLCNTYQI